METQGPRGFELWSFFFFFKMGEKRRCSGAVKKGEPERVRFWIKTLKGLSPEELRSFRSDRDGTNHSHNAGLKNNQVKISRAP